MSIPVVDISRFLRTDSPEGEPGGADAAGRLSRAFECTGFAVVVGHGVDEAIGRRCWEKAKAFHRLPLAQKLPLAIGTNVAPRLCDRTHPIKNMDRNQWWRW